MVAERAKVEYRVAIATGSTGMESLSCSLGISVPMPRLLGQVVPLC